MLGLSFGGGFHASPWVLILRVDGLPEPLWCPAALAISIWPHCDVLQADLDPLNSSANGRR